MDLQLLKQADRILSKCGRPQIPGGSVVELEKKFLLPMVCDPLTSKVFTKEITGEMLWGLKAISSDKTSNNVTGVRLQIQLPNGRFLFGGNGVDAGQFAGVGSNRYLMDPEVDCQPGEKIQCTVTDTIGLGQSVAVNLVFEGAYKVFFKGGEPTTEILASTVPRYQRIVNENILAPCWIHGIGPLTPDGFEDEEFTYSSTGPDGVRDITIPLTIPYATIEIPIESTSDFFMRRPLIKIHADQTVTGASVLARIRAGAGYTLMDDFIDFSKYLCGAEHPHDWKVAADDSVFVELQLADTTGTGNVYVQVHLQGVKRRAK